MRIDRQDRHITYTSPQPMRSPRNDYQSQACIHSNRFFERRVVLLRCTALYCPYFKFAKPVSVCTRGGSHTGPHAHLDNTEGRDEYLLPATTAAANWAG